MNADNVTMARLDDQISLHHRLKTRTFSIRTDRHICLWSGGKSTGETSERGMVHEKQSPG